MSDVFEAVSEDIVMAAGGPMGSPVEVNWRKHFKTMDKAKKFCQTDYGKIEKIKWTRGAKSCRSPDLGHVMYTITKLKVE